MKVVEVSGSARKGGNTKTALDLVGEELEAVSVEVEVIELSDARIDPCAACFQCGGRESCVNDRDDFNRVLEKMKDADGIVLGSPTYGANVSAKMQALLERTAVVADMNPGMLRHKAGAALSVARRAGSMRTMDTMLHLFLSQEMFVAGSSCWNIAYGRLPGEIAQDEEGMATMRTLGKNLAVLLRALGK